MPLSRKASTGEEPRWVHIESLLQRSHSGFAGLLRCSPFSMITWVFKDSLLEADSGIFKDFEFDLAELLLLLGVLFCLPGVVFVQDTDSRVSGPSRCTYLYYNL